MGSKTMNYLIVMGFVSVFLSTNVKSESADSKPVPYVPFKRFGCSCFQGEDFGTIRTSRYDNKRLFGDQVEVLKFKHEAHLKYVFDLIQEVYQDFMDLQVYDDVDAFTEFYDEFRISKLSFAEFYRGFQPDFKMVHDASRLIIKFFYLFVKKWEKNETYYLKSPLPYFHLCTVALSLQGSSEKQILPLKSQIQDFPGQNHVAGFIKFELDDKVGYILIDPGFPHRLPILIMEDETSKFTANNQFNETSWGTTTEGPMSRHTLYKMASDRSFIVGKSTHSTRPSGPFEWHLYYVEKPFCSFLDNIVKRNLVRPRLRMIRRYFNGEIRAALTVLLYPLKQDRTFRPKITLAYTSSEKKDNHKVKEMTMNSTISNHKLFRGSELNHTLDMMTKTLKIKDVDHLIRKIKALQRIFSEGTEFLKVIKEEDASFRTGPAEFDLANVLWN